MKTLTKLTLATVAAMTLGATSLLAGPGPIGPINSPAHDSMAHEFPAVLNTMKCDRMTVNRSPKLGGATVVACDKAVRNTPACRLSCL